MFYQTQKEKFVTDVKDMAYELTALRSRAKALSDRYFSQGLNAGGAHELAESSLAGTQYEGLSVADITNAVTTLQGFETWIDAGHDDNLNRMLI